MSSEVIPQLLLKNPVELPLHPPSAIAEFGSTLVVAPHPDDESLGCGGAIALLRQMGCTVRVLVISDGTLSHPHSRRYPAPALQALRERETLCAVAELGVKPEAVKFLQLKDGSVPLQSTNGFDEAVARCCAYLTAFAPQTILLPWRYDPHPDHRAAWGLIYTAIADLNLSPRLVEYPIWDWDPTQNAAPVCEVTAWRLDISPVLPLKLQAIAAHRSQTTDLIDDDPEGFRLTPEMLANFTHPWELYLEVCAVNQSQRPSLPPSYFDNLYNNHPDPWNFETSEYEANKYSATLAALPKARYRAAFELGCSIGVLTARLAELCDSLLSVDVSEKAMERAIQRCQHLPQVSFQLMRVPEEYPTDLFDLTLVSEVGYYWSWEDLKKAQQLIIDHLEPGGHLLLVHWTLYARDYPLSGDEVHDSFLERNGSDLRHLGGQREEQYRLDLFERV